MIQGVFSIERVSDNSFAFRLAQHNFFHHQLGLIIYFAYYILEVLQLTQKTGINMSITKNKCFDADCVKVQHIIVLIYFYLYNTQFAPSLYYMSDFRLGESQQITPFSVSQIHRADIKLNQFLFDSAFYSVKGLGYGAIASLFFVQKARICWYFTGFGLGYAIYTHCHTILGKKQ